MTRVILYSLASIGACCMAFSVFVFAWCLAAYVAEWDARRRRERLLSEGVVREAERVLENR